jgi:hypothetical protein
MRVSSNSHSHECIQKMAAAYKLHLHGRWVAFYQDKNSYTTNSQSRQYQSTYPYTTEMAAIQQQRQARSSGRPNLIQDFADPPLAAQRLWPSQRPGSATSTRLAGKTTELAAPGITRRFSTDFTGSTGGTHRRGSSGSILSARSAGSTSGSAHGRSLSVSAIPDAPTNPDINGVLDPKAEKHARRQARKENFATGVLAYSGKAGVASFGAGAAVGVPLLFTPFVGLAVGPIAGAAVAGVCTCLSGAPFGVPAYLYLRKHGKGKEALHDIGEQYSASWNKWKGRGKRGAKGVWRGTKATGNCLTCGLLKSGD